MALGNFAKKTTNQVKRKIKAHIRRAILTNPPVLIAIAITVLVVMIILIILGIASSEEYNAATDGGENDSEYVNVDANDFCIHTERSDSTLVLSQSQIQRAINNLSWRKSRKSQFK